MRSAPGSIGVIGAAATVLLVSCSGAPAESPEAPAPEPAPSADVPAKPVDIAGAATCEELATRTVDGVQNYVDTFADVPPAAIADTALDVEEELGTLAQDAGTRASELGCEAESLAALLRSEVDRLHGDGPVAEAVAATLAADLLGSVDPSDPEPSTIEVSSAAELTSALQTAGSGSTIRISAERIRLTEPLLMMRPVTLEGRGADRTRIESSAPGAAMIVLSDGTAHLQELTIRHVGDETASVVVVRRGGYAFDGVSIEGARVDADGAGGFGVVLRPEAPAPTGPVERRITGSTVTSNEGAGIVVAGSESPTLSDIEISGEGTCGLCFSEDAGGEARNIRVEGHVAGIRVDDAAAPDIVDAHVQGAEAGIALAGTGAARVRNGEVVDNLNGVEISGDGAPTLDGLGVHDNAEVGVRITAGAATLSGVSVTGATSIGIAVAGGTPDIVDSRVRTTSDVGIAYAEAGGGTLRDSSVEGPRIGVQVGGTSSASIHGLSLQRLDDAALIVTDQATPTIDDVQCDRSETRIIALMEDAAPELGDQENCEVVDQRDD